MRHSAALAAAAAAAPLALAAGTCPSGAYVIVARASDEPAGFGIIGAVKDQLLSLIPGSSAEAVDYPASFENYFSSESDGVAAMRSDITSFMDSCPNTPVALMGYSQGAQVTFDALVGQEDSGFGANQTLNMPIDSKYTKNIACVIVMGDPSHNTTETFMVGNATGRGLFTRQNVPEFATLGLENRIQSYCDAGDPYCAGGNNSAVHDGYVPEYGDQAAKYCAAKIKGMGVSGGSNSTGNGTASNATTTYSMGMPSATGSSASGGNSPSATGSGASPSSSGAAHSNTAAAFADFRPVALAAGAIVAGFFALM